MFSHPPRLLTLLYPSLEWDIQTDQNEIFLTFDDGPTAGVTEQVLDLLSEYKAKATFFCLGKNIKSYPKIVDRIIKEGHSIGNHTFDHLNGWKTTSSDYLDNIKLFNQYFVTNLFRPPYGKIKRSQIHSIKDQYRIIMWTILSMDYNKNLSPEKCLVHCLKDLKKGSIVVFHDSLKAEQRMIFALRGLLNYCRDAGIKCSRIT